MGIGDPRSDRSLVVAAIAGLIVCSSGLTAWYLAPSRKPYLNCQQGNATYPAASDEDASPSDNGFDLSGSAGLVQRYIANPEPCGGKDNEKRDLAAQEATAYWAFWMVALTLFQSGVGVIGLIAVLRSLEASRDANTLTRDAMIAERRPWVSINPVITGPLEWGADGARVSIRLDLTNYGPSPAIAAFAIAKIAAGAFGFDEKAFFATNIEGLRAAAKARFLGQIIFPGAPVERHYLINLSRDQIAALQARKTNTYPELASDTLIECILFIGVGYAAFDGTIHVTAALHDLSQSRGGVNVLFNVDERVPVGSLILRANEMQAPQID